QILTLRRSPTSASPFQPPASFASNSCTPVKSGDSGSAFGFDYIKPDMASDQVQIFVETVIVQLDTNFTPSGRFPVYANRKSFNRGQIRTGFDAVVCLHRYEPWVI